MAGSISVSGLATGLDTASIISKMMELKRRPIDIISAKKDLYDVKLTELQSLNMKLLSFQSTVKNFSKSDNFLTKAPSFSNNNSADNNEVVSMTANSTAASGSYSLTVESLATAEKEVSQGFDSETSQVSRGNFYLTLGSTRTDITIDSTNNTLEGLKDAINNSGAEVTATILDDGSSSSQYRLVVSGNSAGTSNTLSLDHSGTGAVILGAGGVPDATVVSFTESQSAADASFTLDGLSITRSTNSVTDLLDGVTLDLKSVGSGTVTIGSDSSEVKANVETFVEEYNDLINFITDQLYFDADSGETGVLFGNSAVLDLQNKMRMIISSQVPGLSGAYTTLAQIGISTNTITGELQVDDGNLSDALIEDIQAVANLFIAAGSSDASGLSFIGYTEDAEGGTYNVQVSGGTVQIESSSGSYIDASGSGFYYSGASGNSEGLGFGITSTSNGDKGSITFSLGIAAQFERMLDNLTDRSKQGPLKSELDTLTENISDTEDDIEAQEARLALEEENLTQRFAVLEGFVSRMQSMGDFLSQAQLNISIKR